MAWTTLASLKNHLGIATADTSQDAALKQWIGQAHFAMVKEVHQTIGNLVEAVSVANPTAITCRGHGWPTGAVVKITGTAGYTTPSLDGQQTITRVDDDTFTIPVNVTAVNGTPPNGNLGWINRVYQNVYYSGDGTKLLKLRQRPIQSVQSIYYDPNGYFGVPSGVFDATTSILVAGTDYVLFVDNEETGWSHRGHVARIGGYWVKPNERQRGILSSVPGDSLGNIKISYTAGWGWLPTDLQLAENQLVGIIRKAGVDLPLQSESLDYYSYNLAGFAEAKEIIGGIYKTLGNYKEWRMAGWGS